MTGRTVEEILAERRAIEEARAMNEAPAVTIPDPLVQYRMDAEASLAADRAEIEHRQRKAARERREISIMAEVDRRIAAALAGVDARIAATVDDGMAKSLEHIVKVVSDPLASLDAKIDKVEGLFADLQKTLTAMSTRPERGDFAHMQ